MTESPRHEQLQSFVLVNQRVEARIETRGSFLSDLRIDGEEIIYFPRSGNPGRGGIPVLGPTPGPVKSVGWKNLYPDMPQHGSDRDSVWSVESSIPNEVILQRFVGPKEFLLGGRITMKFLLLKNGIRIERCVENFEDKPREVGSGLHPYFSVGKNGLTFEDEKVKSLHPLEPGESVIVTPGLSKIVFEREGKRFRLLADPTPIQTVFWSDDPLKYEAIEPWWAKVGSGDVISPQEARRYSFEIAKVD